VLHPHPANPRRGSHATAVSSPARFAAAASLLLVSTAACTRRKGGRIRGSANPKPSTRRPLLQSPHPPPPAAASPHRWSAAATSSVSSCPATSATRLPSVFSTQVRHYYLSSPPQFACQFGPDVLAVLPPATKTHRFPMLFTQQIRPQQRSESNIPIFSFADL
jgi:hypothetical protein